MHDETARLSRQCQQILDRLRKGQASNRELAGYALKYTGRVSELREAGHDIQVVSRDRKTGLTYYALRESRGAEQMALGL